ASEVGKLVLTTAPWRAPVAILEQRVHEHGDGNTRRIPLRTAVEGVPRERRARAALLHPSSAQPLHPALVSRGVFATPLTHLPLPYYAVIIDGSRNRQEN